MLLLGVIALIVIGPRQLPEFARQVGRILNEIKRAAGDFTHEMKNQVRVDFDQNQQNQNPPITPNDQPPLHSPDPPGPSEFKAHSSLGDEADEKKDKPS